MRLANTWTKTTEEAFGASGAKGRIGEVFVINTFQNDGYQVIDHEDDRKFQLSGIDLTYANTTVTKTADVKHNLNNWHTFYVECNAKGWLFKSKADQIIHCNVAKKTIAMYNVSEMRQYVLDKRWKEPLMPIKYMEGPSFVNWKFNV